MYRVMVRARLARDPGFEHHLENDLADAIVEEGFNDGSDRVASFDVFIRTVYARLQFPADSLEQAVKRALDDVSSAITRVAPGGHALLAVSVDSEVPA